MVSSQGSCTESYPSFLNSCKSPAQGLVMLKSRHIPTSETSWFGPKILPTEMSTKRQERCQHEYLISVFFSKKCLKNSFSWLLYILIQKNLLGKQSHSKIHKYFLFIFNIIIRYSWILWKILVNRNNICQNKIFANRNNIHEMKLWRIEIGIYLLQYKK